MSSTISEIHTSCKDCNFAEYDEKTQVGCRLDLLKRYSEVLPCVDEEGEFFVVNNGVCIFKDNKAQNKGVKFDYEVMKRNISKLLSFKYRIIVLCDATNEEHIKTTIDSIRSLDYKPEHVTLVLKKGVIYKAEFTQELFVDSGIDWRVEMMVENKDREGNELSNRYLVDHILLNKGIYSNWYMVVHQGLPVDNDYVNNVKNFVNSNEKIKYVFYKAGFDLSFFVGHTLYHLFVAGNKYANLEDKLPHLCLGL